MIWLLRSDLRNGAKPSDPISESFRQWWLTVGRSNYPVWGSELDESSRKWLAEPFFDLPLAQRTLRLPRALSIVYKSRPDVLQTFSNNGKVNAVAVSAWFFLMGLKELALAEIVDDNLIHALDQPLLDAQHYQVGDGVPAVSALMRLVWELLSEPQKVAMPLHQTDGREAFIDWFFGVAVQKYPIAFLIAKRWCNWLREEIPVPEDTSIALPRFALIGYHVQPELQKRFSLRSRNGLLIYRNWIEKNNPPVTGPWAWLTQAPTLPNAKRSSKSSVQQPQISLAQRPVGVNLIGFAFAEIGIAEDLRMAVAACEAAGIAYRVVNINIANLRQGDLELQKQVADADQQAAYAINIFCMPVFDVVDRIFLQMGSQMWMGHYNIAWSPWELSVWPKAWKNALQLFDEIWAGSPFSLAMYRKATIKPSTMVPLAASVERVGKYSRKHFALPAKTFLYLYIFDFNSHLARKNPLAAIAGFQKAFPKTSAEQVGLVLKVMHAQATHPQWLELERICKSDPRIMVINRVMDRPEILGLVKACDAYVSPHRAEGFGRTLAEAMLFGKPVIATNYSGNEAFMDPQLTFPVEYQLTPVKEGEYHFVEATDGATWAAPSVTDLAQKMNDAKERARDRHYAKQVKAFAQAYFAPARTGEILKKRLQQIYAQLRILQSQQERLALAQGRTEKVN